MTANNYSQKHILQIGDILFARTGGTVGKTYYYDGTIGNAIFAGYCIRFRFDVSKVLPKFVYWNTKTNSYLKWVKGIQRPSGQPNINKGEFKSYEISVPDYTKQKQLCSFMDEAEKKYNKKLQQADELLSGINVEMSKLINVSFTILKKREFYGINRKDICLNLTHRLDFKAYHSHFKMMQKAISKSRYNKTKLKDLVTDNVAGNWGEALDVVNNDYQKCLVLRATEIDNRQNIFINPEKAQYRMIKKNILADMDIQKGDILVEKSGGSTDQPVGRVVIIEKTLHENCPIAYSNFLAKLRINKDLVDPYYLFEYLRFIYSMRVTEAMETQTNGIHNLIVSEFLNQEVVIPPNNKEIGEKIKSVREKAKIIKIEAEKEWAEAKVQFEKELLEG